MTSATLNTTIPAKAITMGNIAKFSEVDRRLFHNFEADRISDALRSTIRHMTLIMLRSDTPTVANMPMTEVVAVVTLVALIVLATLVALIVLATLVALIVLATLVALIVLIIEESIHFLLL
jgi:hypothetical protein